MNAPQILDFILTFSSVLWEAMPFIVLGAVVAGFLEEFLPQQLVTRFMPSSALPAVLVGGLLGLAFPMCECGIVVVMRRLLRKGVPLACCVTYMLAGPIVNVVVLLSTYAAFEGHEERTPGIVTTMIVGRAGLGFLVAVVTGLVVHRLQKASGTAALLTAVAMPPGGRSLAVVEETAPERPKTLMGRLNNISATALHDFIDITVFLILGAILAAIAKLYIGNDTIDGLSREQPMLAIPAMMLMAVLMCLCSEADAFVAASFTKMAVSSKLAFLVLGPMLDLKLLLMYTRVFRPKLIAVIVSCTVLQVFAYTTAIYMLKDRVPAPAPAASADQPSK